jgi:uncharacterized protein YwqG
MFSRWFGKKRDDTPVRDVAALTASMAHPAVHVVKTDAPSLSHFGGSPNLPPGRRWPECDRGRLGFLARLSLPEIHRAQPVDWLPRTGALLFFYDMEQQPWGFDPRDRGGSAVLLVPDLPAPVPQSGAGPDDSRSPVSRRNVAFRRIEVLPSWERDAVRALELSDRESDRLDELTAGVFRGEPRHQVSGYPTPVQGDEMELECQLVSNGLYGGDSTGYADKRAEALKPGAADWRLLLQVDSDDALGVMWGDGGTIYYWVQKQAARDERFDNTWLVLQCH